MKLFKFVYVILFFTTVSLFSDQLAPENYIQKTLEKPGQPFNSSPAPSWVREIDYEIENIEENIDATGVAYLLYNNQYNLEKKIRYIREAKKIVSRGALTDACTIPITFEFKQRDLTMHHINIIRNGEVIEKLATAKKRCFYPATPDSQNIQQVFFYIDNLHVGDIIDIAYSCMEKDNFLKQPFGGDRFLIRNLALYKKIAYDCLIDKDRPIFWNTYLFEQDPTCSFRDIYTVYSWEINDYNIEFVPANYESTRDLSIVISTNKWNDIAKYFATIFKEKTNFSPAPPKNITQLVNEWQNIYPTQEEQILAAIKLASDDIYYLSIPDDEEEHYTTPYSPSETLEKHYGDCKDKTSLLIALLKLLDIEAYPVLVMAEKTDKNQLPNFYFDHVIVNIKYDGKSYFVDPTVTMLGGTLDTYQVPDFGYGLLLKEDSEDLIPITRNYLSKFQSMATISIQNGDVNVDHIAQYCHRQAAQLRRKLRPGYIDRIGENILAYITNEFPHADVMYTSPLQLEDDRRADVITRMLSLSVKNIGMKTTTGFLYNLSSLLNGKEITLPIGTDFSKAIFLEDENIRMEIHKTIDIHCDKVPNIEEKRVSYADDNLSYNLTIEKISDTDIRVILHQEILKNYIPADELPHFSKKLEEFKNHLSLKIEIPN